MDLSQLLGTITESSPSVDASDLLWAATLIVTVVIGAVTAWVYNRQLKTMQFTTLIPYLESPAVRNARATIMENQENIQTNPFSWENPWASDLRRAAAEVCASYDVVGHLARLNKVDCDFLLAHWGHSAIRMWDVLGSYIEACGDSEDEWYLGGFKWFVDLAKQSKAKRSARRGSLVRKRRLRK